MITNLKTTTWCKCITILKAFIATVVLFYTAANLYYTPLLIPFFFWLWLWTNSTTTEPELTSMLKRVFWGLAVIFAASVVSPEFITTWVMELLSQDSPDDLHFLFSAILISFAIGFLSFVLGTWSMKKAMRNTIPKYVDMLSYTELPPCMRIG